MANPTICTVSGTIMDSTFTPIVGATIKVSLDRPYVDPTSGALIPNLAIQTLTGSGGMWSVALIETTTANIGLTFTISYVIDQNNAVAIYEYTAIIPDARTANFTDLITGQT